MKELAPTIRSERHDICDECGGKNISREPTPFQDDDGPRIVIVYRCLNCGVLCVPDFEGVA